MRERFSPTNQFSSTNCVFNNLTQFCYLPRDSVRYHRLRAQSHQTALTPLHMPIVTPGCHLYLWVTGYKSEVIFFFSQWHVSRRKVYYFHEKVLSANSLAMFSPHCFCDPRITCQVSLQYPGLSHSFWAEPPLLTHVGHEIQEKINFSVMWLRFGLSVTNSIS